MRCARIIRRQLWLGIRNFTLSLAELFKKRTGFVFVVFLTAKRMLSKNMSQSLTCTIVGGVLLSGQVYAQDEINIYQTDNQSFHLERQQVDSCIAKCEELMHLIEQGGTYSCNRSECFLMIVEKVAPYDTEFAREVACKIKSAEHFIKALVVISQYQDDEDAKLTLQEAKRANPLFLQLWMLIYNEEIRRGFSEAQATRNTLIQKLKPTSLWNLYGLTNITKECEISALNEVLEEVNFPSYLEAEGVLRKEFETGEGVESWERIEDWQRLGHWIRILILEATYPCLSSFLEQDFCFFLETFAINDRDENYLLIKLLKALASSNIELAHQVFSKISHPEDVLKGMIILFKAQAGQASFDQEAALKEILKQVDQVIFWYQPRSYIRVFKLVAEFFDLDRAVPYLDRAKALVNEYRERGDYDDDPGSVGEEFADILRAEVLFDLPSIRDTLATLKQVIEEESFTDIDTIPALIEAELALCP